MTAVADVRLPMPVDHETVATDPNACVRVMLGIDGVDAAGPDREVVDVASLDPDCDRMQHAPIVGQSRETRPDCFFAFAPQPPSSLVVLDVEQPLEPRANGSGVALRSLHFRGALAGPVQSQVALRERSSEQAGLNLNRRNNWKRLLDRIPSGRYQSRNCRRELSRVCLILQVAHSSRAVPPADLEAIGGLEVDPAMPVRASRGERLNPAFARHRNRVATGYPPIGLSRGPSRPVLT